MDGYTGSAFNRILIPLDGSPLAEQALPYARAVAASDARFIPIAVAPPPESDRDDVGRIVGSVDEVLARIEGELREQLLAAARTWLGDDTDIRPIVTTGDPAEEILRAAATCTIDLIALASHGRGSMGRALFGSVADRVSRASPVPVLIVRPRDAPIEISPIRIHRIVVPLDGSGLAANALPLAEALARRLDVPVVLVRAIEGVMVPAVYPDSFGLQVSEIEAMEADARGETAAVARNCGERGIAAHASVHAGWPFEVITSEATAGDLIVMTSHGRSGVRRWLLGSVAEKLIRSGPAPVMLVPVGARVPLTADLSSPSKLVEC